MMPEKNDNPMPMDDAERETELGSSTGDHTPPTLLDKFIVPRASVGERIAAGKALRAKLPREEHGEFRRHPTRQDPVSIIEEQAKTRLPFLVPIRHSRMLASPFAFLRGAAAVMAADLAHTPTTGMKVQACGDMHVANFGVFASAERTLVFGINDFDETLPGSWEWDLKRLAASAVVCGRFLGGDRALCEESARAVVKSYRKRIREYAEMSYLDVWYARIDERDVLNALPSPMARKRTKQTIAKAKKRGHLQVLDKMAELVGNQQRIIEVRPFIVRETHTEYGRPIAEGLGLFLESYFQSLPDDRKVILSRYRILDVARKVVGVGSVGTRCWVVLMQGNEIDDPLFLQVKEAQASVLAPYAGASGYANNGQRVVVGQRIIQGAPDIFLGWGEVDDHAFYVRQLRDMKGGAEFDPKTTPVESFPEYTALCGWALALAHAKSGDAAMLAGYLGKSGVIDDAIARFAASYADQTEQDHKALAAAARQGRIPVATES
jgi:uncharacterized protein (DUF2252 family)